MKKFFAIVLVVCLAVGMAFAAKSTMKVGAQAGIGTLTSKYSISAGSLTNYWKYQQSGFYFAGTFEYAASDAIGVKAIVGMNTYGDTKISTKVNDGDWSSSSGSSDKLPAQFLIFVGPVYALELSDDLAIDLAAGFELMTGKESKNDDAKSATEAGFGLEASGEFAASKEFALSAGIRWSMMFGSKNDHDYKYSSFKFFAGATYAL